MGALTDLWNSERGIFGIVLIICATVLVGLGYAGFDAWQKYTTLIFGFYVSGKTATSVAGIIFNPKPPAPPTEVVTRNVPPDVL